MRWTILLISIITSLAATVPAQQPKWIEQITELKILESDDSDVLRIMNLRNDSKQISRQEDGAFWLIDSDEGQMQLRFAQRDKCNKVRLEKVSELNVPAWTLREMSFIPSRKATVPLDQLLFSLAGFQMLEVNNGELYTYISKDEDILISTTAVSSVTSITLQPPRSINYLKCPEQ